MNRRRFINSGALFALLIFIPRLICAQSMLTAHGVAKARAKAAGGGGGGGDITTGLVARWKFDEGSGTSAADDTGNGNTGTLNGTTGWAAGKIGANCISYPNVSDSGISISPLALGTTFTYAAWVYHVSGGGGYQNLLTQSGATGFWLVGNKIDFYYGGDHSSTTAISDNAWHHIAVVNNGGSVTFYLDGAADGTASSGPSFTANGMGADGGNGGEQFAGKHDDVRIYSRALSATDIATLYSFTGP